MRSGIGLCFIVLTVASMASTAAAQWQVGAVYSAKEQPPYVVNPPQALPGYNPFRYNPQNGHFDYVPIPYEPQRPGPNYDPYRFNWHSGRFDYRPWGPPYDMNQWARGDRGGDDLGGNASNYLDTRIYSQPPSAPLSSRAATDVTGEPVTASAQLPPPPPLPPMLVPQVTARRTSTTGPTATTMPTTGPSSPRAPGIVAGPDGWVRLRGVVGRWDYDYSTGRWVFVLRGD